MGSHLRTPRQKKKGVEMMKGKLEKAALDLQLAGACEASLDAATSQTESVRMQAATVKPVALNAVTPAAIVIDEAVVDPTNGFNVVLGPVVRNQVKC